MATFKATWPRPSTPRQATPPPQGQNPDPGFAGTPADKLQGSQRDAYIALTALFKSYGLESLAPVIFNYVKQGYGADTISVLLQDTDAYKQRFAGNQLRQKAGLAVLSPADYLATEASYRQILQSAGLPAGFYDQPSDFTSWIGGDVSPTEVQNRVNLAVQDSSQASDSVKQALQQMYGVSQGDLTAYFLDADRSLPILQKQAQAAQFGAEALKRGLALDTSNLEDMATSGLSQDQVASGFSQIAQTLPDLEVLARRWGTTFTQGEAEQDVFTQTGGAATKKRQGLASQERALFSSSAGGAAGGLSPDYQAV